MLDLGPAQKLSGGLSFKFGQKLSGARVLDECPSQKLNGGTHMSDDRLAQKLNGGAHMSDNRLAQQFSGGLGLESAQKLSGA